MTKETARNLSCSDLSIQTNEEMFGTALRVDVWFLLEYRGAWEKKAFPLSKIPEKVKKFISEHIDSIPNSRLQVIKQYKNPQSSLKFYIAISDESEPQLFEFSFSDYEELLSLNVSEIITGKFISQKEPLFIICTHGAHDGCCGTSGVPVYLEAARNQNGFSVWQSTHLGGHRFAATLVCLPHGIYYGRVNENDVIGLINEYKYGRISLEKYRGRSCYPPEVQAAEYFLRSQTGNKEISRFHLKQMEKLDKDRFKIEFISRVDDKIHLVQVERNPSALLNYTSCGDDDKSAIAQYRLVEYQEI